ncbi:MAG: rRNA cytosine-C5-methyltransferase [Tannerella sp.]|jgi:16S rRNA C967 or C1407 C5-methylase (RsmB/RsmF family)|nr:rRNA cytosine-C5-methyltransferase [Tannerella sp.]
MINSEFVIRTKELLPDDYEALFAAIDTEPPVSIRFNRYKASGTVDYKPVLWCDRGYYLPERPSFTFDPLFHAGVYYVQEASSMFVEQAFKTILASEGNAGLSVLDLCAAPGGKSTHILDLLPDNSLLVANEIIRSRCAILAENIAKWGNPNVIVTNSAPARFAKEKGLFDVIIADLPCSGEGMFRKDRVARKEWSVDNVLMCADRQRHIVSDVWQALKPGGRLIYSTCTFNTEENEDNVSRLASELGAEVIDIPVKPEWNIVGALKHDIPAYRFFPHRTRGEGFFLAMMRKNGSATGRVQSEISRKIQNLCNTYYVPSAASVLSTAYDRNSMPAIDLSYDQAIKYLRREALILPTDVPKGYITVTYQGHPLGIVKNIGSRANNLYPIEWRIRDQLKIKN